jgi:uncharacterized protein (DUF2249 family)
VSATGRAALDLRELPPPQPLERALAAIDALAEGAFVHLVLVHEPLPLLALLPDRAIAWRVVERGRGETHVICWRRDDAAATQAAAEAAQGLSARP